MPFQKKRLQLAGGVLLIFAVAGIAVYNSSRHDLAADQGQTDSSSPLPDQQVANSSSPDRTSDNAARTVQNPPSSPPSPAQGQSEGDIHSTLDKSPQPAETVFTRGDYFKPVQWGPDLKAVDEKENQKLSFKPACKAHPRTAVKVRHPSDWAGDFTKSEAQFRWPAASAHVIDWNQYWQVADKGIQISIRWNFDLPARYTVVGYSFALAKPDGYGTPLWQEMSEMSWDEAKDFVTKWEQKTLAEGGKAGTRTMSLAEKPFNPAEVSTEEIERAEYSNARVRSAQSGKMHCSSPALSPAELNCGCWF
jgi:hypothetical protein